MDLPNATHRPWSLPSHSGVMAMQWHDLLFMHWPVPAVLLCAAIPSALYSTTALGVGVPRTQRSYLRDHSREAGHQVFQLGRQ